MKSCFIVSAQILHIFPNIADPVKCEELCWNIKDCKTWSHNCSDPQSCVCTQYLSTYLHTCQVVGGDIGTDLEVRLVLSTQLFPFYFRFAWNKILGIVEILLKRIAGFRAVWSGLTRSQIYQFNYLIYSKNTEIY